MSKLPLLTAVSALALCASAADSSTSSAATRTTASAFPVEQPDPIVEALARTPVEAIGAVLFGILFVATAAILVRYAAGRRRAINRGACLLAAFIFTVLGVVAPVVMLAA